MGFKRNVKNGLGFGIGVLMVFGFIFGIYAFVEPGVAPSGGNNIIDSGSPLLSSNSWQNCEVLRDVSNDLTTMTLTCTGGKSIRDISHTCSRASNDAGSNTASACGLTAASTTSITGRGDYYNGGGSIIRERFSASIICCDD